MCDRMAPSAGLHPCFGLQEMLLRLSRRGQPPPSIREIDGSVYRTPHALAVKPLRRPKRLRYRVEQVGVVITWSKHLIYQRQGAQKIPSVDAIKGECRVIERVHHVGKWSNCHRTGHTRSLAIRSATHREDVHSSMSTSPPTLGRALH